MLNAANWTARLNELATEANVPGACAGHLVRRAGDPGRARRAERRDTGPGYHHPCSRWSITKIWTATIMRLVDEGLLSLDTTVRRHHQARGRSGGSVEAG